MPFSKSSVLDSRGDPVADASVSLKRRQTGSMQTTVIINGLDMGSTSAPTAEDGSFSILGVADGQYDMSVLDATKQPLAWAGATEGAAPAEPAPLEVAGGQNQDGLNLVVEAQNGVIQGTVSTAEGEPAPDVWVTATRMAEQGLPGPARDDLLFRGMLGLADRNGPQPPLIFGEHRPAVCADQLAPLFEKAQVFADSHLRHPEPLGQVLDTHLLQPVQYGEDRLVALVLTYFRFHGILLSFAF